MSDPERSSKPRMSEPEAVLVDVVRLVARGDADAVPRRVEKLLRGVGGRRAQQLSEPCRAALTRAVADAPYAGPTLRRSVTAGEPERPLPLAEAGLSADSSAPPPKPVLPISAQQVLDRLLAEHEQAESLSSLGVEPARSLLLSGPPGVGKTMTATFIAWRLDLPLLRAEPSTIVTSLLGESARNLAAAFEEARRKPSLLLLDEFDAFAKRRDDTHEVGELKRFVTTLLVELERGLPHGMLVAATNHPDLLDPAVHRRFDAIVELEVPDPGTRRMILNEAFSRLALDVDLNALELTSQLTEGLSGSDLQRLANDATKAHVLSDEPLGLALLRAATPSVSSAPRSARIGVAQMAKEAGLSAREVGRILGCSHTSVLRMLESSSESGHGQHG